jgi:hypothetical protein
MAVEKLKMFEEYLNELKTRGERLPTRVSDMKPNFRAISAASGVGYKYLCTHPFRQRITLAVKEIGLTPPETSRELRRQQTFEKNRALLSAYLEWLGKYGFKLPEDPRHRGQVFFRQVEIEAGLSHDALTLKNVASDNAPTVLLKKAVTIASRRGGVEVRILTQFPGQRVAQFTYERLRDRGSEARAIELENKPRSRQQLYNTRTALNRFLKLLKLKTTDTVGEELASNFELSLTKVTGKIKAQASRKKLQTELRWWRGFYQKLIKAEVPGRDFLQTFAHLVDRSGLPFPALSAFVGIPAVTLRTWYRGGATPSGVSIDALSRFEKVFKLPAGALINKLPAGNRKQRFRRKDLPPCLSENRRLADKVNRHLPDNFLDLNADKQERVIASIRADVLGEGSARRREMVELQKLSYRLKKWPKQLEDEFGDLVALKAGERAPLGRRRHGRWRVASKDKHERDMGFFFGALRLDADAADVRMRGLGLPDEHLTMALIACPLLADWYLRFRGETRNKYTEYLVGLTHFFSSLLKPVTGWLRQRPDLASRLRPVSFGGAQLVSEGLISRALSDWDGVCDDAISHYKFLKEEIEPLVTTSRDPFRPIRPILDLDDPFNAVEALLEGMRQNLPNPHTQPLRYHTVIRNCALVAFVFATGLRRNTVAQLNYTGDKASHLVRENGTYVLNVPRQLFKEEDSKYFGSPNAKEDHCAEVPDVFGLYGLLDEYLSVSRPLLLKNNGATPDEQALFVTSRKCQSVRLSARLVTIHHTDATGMHLTWNRWRGTGIPGATAMGPHAARHIRATAAYKKTGSLGLAADSIQITEETAFKHYARLTTKERNKRVNEVLFGGRIRESLQDNGEAK